MLRPSQGTFIAPNRICNHKPNDLTLLFLFQVYRGFSSIAYVVDIVSFAISGGTSLLSIYTRVAFDADWIEKHVWPELSLNTTNHTN